MKIKFACSICTTTPGRKNHYRYTTCIKEPTSLRMAVCIIEKHSIYLGPIYVNFQSSVPHPLMFGNLDTMIALLGTIAGQ